MNGFHFDESQKNLLILYRFTRKLINESKNVLNNQEWTFDGSPFKNTDSLSFRYGLFAFDYLLGISIALVDIAFMMAMFFLMDYLPPFVILLLPFVPLVSIIVVPKKVDRRRLGREELLEDALEMQECIKERLEKTISGDRQDFLKSATEFLDIAIKELSTISTGNIL